MDALANERPFEFGGGAQDVKQEAPGRIVLVGVEALGNAEEAYAVPLERLDVGKIPSRKTKLLQPSQTPQLCRKPDTLRLSGATLSTTAPDFGKSPESPAEPLHRRSNVNAKRKGTKNEHRSIRLLEAAGYA
jgi:hypothetical protein